LGIAEPPIELLDFKMNCFEKVFGIEEYKPFDWRILIVGALGIG
jgi:hypothetical protein